MVSAPSEVRVYVLGPPPDKSPPPPFKPYVAITDLSNNMLGNDNQPLGVFVAAVEKAEGDIVKAGLTEVPHS